MPNDNDDLEDMTIEQINVLFEDTIEIPDEYKISASVPAASAKCVYVGPGGSCD